MSHKTLTEQILDEKVKIQSQIILFNDDVNTFDWVIECLIKYCNHTTIQAEQCAHIVHFKGKCAVKTGPLPQLLGICQALCEKGLSAVIQ